MIDIQHRIGATIIELFLALHRIRIVQIYIHSALYSLTVTGKKIFDDEFEVDVDVVS